jgi:hypothetical protein
MSFFDHTGMAHLSRETGLTRESLYNALSEDGNPRLSSLDAILRSTGLQLNIKPLSPDAAHDEDLRTARPCAAKILKRLIEFSDTKRVSEM